MSRPATIIPTPLLSVTAFVSGFIILSLEMVGFRLLAPYFGYSTYVWGSLLGVILSALSAGYYLGGILADKKPEGTLVFDLILYSILYLIGVLLFYGDLLKLFSNTGIIWGSIFSTTVIFGPPMLFLGMISPFLIKLLAQKDTVGITAGKIFSISTGGSILGTFFTSFVLIPRAGSFKTLNILIVTLLVLYISGYIRRFAKTAVGLALIVFVLLVPGKKSESRVIYETESAYNLIQVEKRDDNYSLFLNDSRWLQSHYKKGYISTGGYYDFMLLGMILTEFKDVLVLGAGAGVSIRQFLFFSPEVKVDAVEIDPKVVETARKFFDWKDDPRVNTYIEDARPFLSRSNKQYDLIEMDAFAGGPFVPFYLTTREYFELVFQRLKPGGIMLMNVLASEKDKTFLSHMGNTVKSVFPSLFVVELKKNILFIATRETMSLDLVKNELRNNPGKKLGVIVEHALNNISEFHRVEGIPIFTDDWAPTAELIYEIIKEEYQ